MRVPAHCPRRRARQDAAAPRRPTSDPPRESVMKILSAVALIAAFAAGFGIAVLIAPPV
jgi:hypothetical protein